MGESRQPALSVVERSTRPRMAVALWGFLAVLAHVALLDAAVETFWNGSPFEWWAVPLVLIATVSLWAWRPGGGLLGRFGPTAAAATPLFGLLAVLAVTAWLPGGRANGVRMLLQPTPRVAVGAVALAALLAAGAFVRGRPRGRLVGAVWGALALVIVSAGFAARRQTGPMATSAAQDGPGLGRLTVASLQLPVARTPDLAHVEPENFAAALGKDPSRIFDFVRDQVAYEPYAGCLRGPRGTLLALAGNSTDRAALLASLLTHSGQKVRFVQGQLPDAQARVLVASVFAPRAEAASADAAPSDSAKAVAETIGAGVKRDLDLLATRLKGTGAAHRAEVPSVESLVAEARDHYWVQWWRDGAWTDLDPSFAASVPGVAYARPATTFDALPEALFHRVNLRVRLEEYTGATPSTREIVTYSAKAADLAGVDLALVHVVEHPPDERSRSGLGALGGGVPGQAGQVRPFLVVRGQAVAGLPFWQTAPRKSGGLGFDSLLGGGGEEAPADVPVGVAEFLQMEFVRPGGRTDSVSREIFDLVGPARRRKGEALSASEVAARTQAASSDAPTVTVADLLVTTGALHAAHLENVVSLPEQAKDDLVDVRGALQRLNVLFAATSDQLVNRLTTPDGGTCRFYLDSPRVQILELSARSSGLRLALDLRRDQARAVGSGARKEFVFAAQLLRGVVDGHLERALIDHFGASEDGKPSPPPMSTSLAFDLAQASNAPIALLEKDTTELANDVPADGRARLEEALASGSVAVAPKNAVTVAGTPRFAWWQVDPRSGVTTAVTDEGLHAAVVEVSIVHSNTNDRTSFIIGFRGFGRVQHIAHTVSRGEAVQFAKDIMAIFARHGLTANWTQSFTALAL